MTYTPGGGYQTDPYSQPFPGPAFPSQSGYPPMPPPPQPPAHRRGLTIALAAIGAVAIAGTAVVATLVATTKRPEPSGTVTGTTVNTAQSAAPTTMIVTGTMTLKDDDLLVYEGGCAGDGGYSDISDGASVTVTDAAGAIVGLGHLTGSETSGYDECVFSFVVSDVPTGKGFYGVEVTHRGAVKYGESDLATPVHVSLGT
ncbi:hypothetical protein [Actinoplanes sp. NPDC089786]|uniref:hypothetical protein n=1 Tax=Actinoplanes sp. NPDC089786 TaxID=3155185 RepID=UPI0034428E36